MKKDKNVKFGALFLLVVYFANLVPSFFLHHHDEEIVSYNEATSCEKSIFYSYSNEKCDHKTHLNKSQKSCLLCDYHFSSPHFLEFSFYKFLNYSFKNTHSSLAKDYSFETFSLVSNRGPPTA
ncbi:hypothetical protein EGI22_13475 [Lacihabitans sp. LS3-19]|uniref:hypothetical protein n=1 Tax=Lacihabitans sp. LS3-19 TaxID=2487335 RepID=UPI0020CC19EA|nr:hypothetical protein [Lacihabitans sp. LS3-19]MCP9768924.1 hypothetical protein [Lacihabitans sp. LS3-19]